jgi:hypothetical protein
VSWFSHRTCANDAIHTVANAAKGSSGTFNSDTIWSPGIYLGSSLSILTQVPHLRHLRSQVLGVPRAKTPRIWASYTVFTTVLSMWTESLAIWHLKTNFSTPCNSKPFVQKIPAFGYMIKIGSFFNISSSHSSQPMGRRSFAMLKLTTTSLY